MSETKGTHTTIGIDGGRYRVCLDRDDQITAIERRVDEDVDCCGFANKVGTKYAPWRTRAQLAGLLDFVTCLSRELQAERAADDQ